MNNEFITRYYSGTGAVLIPSHGIVQVFEDEYGNISMQGDVIKESLLNPNNGTLSNKQLISDYINARYSSKTVDWGDIEIGDTVLVKPEVDQKYVDILNKYPELYAYYIR